MATILVIDDDAAVLRVVVRALSAAGHRVVQAANGRDALSRVADERPEVVVTDIFMPEMDGIETIRAIRRLNPGVRIIAMSGGAANAALGGAPHFLGVAQALGADAVIEKPFRIPALLDLVQAGWDAHSQSAD